MAHNSKKSEIIDMKSYIKTFNKKSPRIPLHYVVFLSITSLLTISCNNQDKRSVLKKEALKLDTIPLKGSKPQEQTFNFITELPAPIPSIGEFHYNGQLCYWIRKIFQDKKGNLWFGTNHYGAIRFDGDTLEYFSERDGLGDGRVNDIATDKAGNIWIATYKGLCKYSVPENTALNSKPFVNYFEKEGLINNEVWSIEIDKNGLFWLGTMEGVFQFDGKNFTPFPLPKISVKDTTSGLSPKRVKCIYEDKKGNLWFGTDGVGLYKYHPSSQENSFTHFSKQNGLPDNNINGILEDKEGNIWIATMSGGISFYNGRTFTNFTEKGKVDGIETTGLYRDKNDNIWFAAENVGVYRYNGSDFNLFSEKDGLGSNGIISILEDNQGRFWLGGWKGLFRYAPQAKENDEKPFFPITKNGPWEGKP